MIYHHAVPDSLLEAETDFSAHLRVRNKQDGLYSHGISLYRRVIRENIINVLKSVFTIFCQGLKDDNIRDLVDAFIEQHRANLPEFHQLATELLLFLRQRSDLSTVNQSLIEYEWLIYALEIDESYVPAPKQSVVENLSQRYTQVIVNPTLRMVALPFLLKDGAPHYEENPQLHYYALYRKYDNTIFQKSLNIADVQLLQKAGNESIMIEMLKDKAGHHLTSQSLLQWLEANNRDEVISIISKG